MRPLWLGLLTILAAAQAPMAENVQGPSLTDPQITETWSTICSVEGRSFEFLLSDADLVDSPRWEDPKSVLPPLLIARAIVVSQSELHRYVSKPSDWAVEGVAFHRLGAAGKWFYVISWRPA